MTTIIGYKEGRVWSLYADSRASGGHYNHDDRAEKLFAWGPWAFGICGRTALYTHLEYSSRCEPDGYPDDPFQFAEYWKNLVRRERTHGASTLMTNGKRLYFVEETGYVREVKEKYYAIGSGADYAMGALGAGLHPLEAYKVVKRLDLGTGGKIMHMQGG